MTSAATTTTVDGASSDDDESKAPMSPITVNLKDLGTDEDTNSAFLALMMESWMRKNDCLDADDEQKAAREGPRDIPEFPGEPKLSGMFLPPYSKVIVPDNWTMPQDTATTAAAAAAQQMAAADRKDA